METIKICYYSLYKNQELLHNISKNQFEKRLRSALRDNYFLFDGIIYQQIDGVAMRSTLDPTISFKILRFFDVLPNFPFTAGETMGDYYL